MQKTKNVLFFISASIILIVTFAILFISPTTKYLIGKYGMSYTGRQITLDWAYVNPFTGYLYLSNLKIREFQSDSIFLSVEGVSAHVSILKLFSDTYEFSGVLLDHPRGVIVQNRQFLNFNDLIARFSDPADSIKVKKTTRLNFVGVKITDGAFTYREQTIPINYTLKNVNIDSPGKQWNSDTIALKCAFSPETGSGHAKGDFTLNLKNSDYHYTVVAQKFDLQILEQYLKDISNNGRFSANLDADIQVKGNFKDTEDFTTSGLLAVNDFHLGKNNQDDDASFDRLAFAMHQMSPKNYIYQYDSVALIRPFFKYEQQDTLNNLAKLFGRKGNRVAAVSGDTTRFNLIVEIGRYLQTIGRNFMKSPYRVDRLAISHGTVQFSDFTRDQKFSVSLDPFDVSTDSINRNRDRINFYFKSGIQPSGNGFAELSLSPSDSGFFDLKYGFQKIPAPLFNPYTVLYTSFPLDQGTVEVEGRWNVRKSIIRSRNHVTLKDAHTGKQVKNKDAHRLPIPLMVFLLRAHKQVIDYDIPVTGTLRKPKINTDNMVSKLFKLNFFKPLGKRFWKHKKR
jgi:hypothetical protein